MATVMVALRTATLAIALFIFLETQTVVAQVVADKDDRATTVQLPTLGVSIDADGLLSFKSILDPTGELRLRRARAALATLPGPVARRSKLRKVSLRKLDAAIQARFEKGQPPTDAMKHLAGLTRVEYVFVYPETGDIVLAGPAEGWMDDGVGRMVGVETGLPVLLLEDLAVAFRAFFSGPEGARNPWIACSIDPTPEGIRKLQAFQKTIPKQVPMHARAESAVRLATGLQESLGNANIRVHGISAKSHMAQVLVEADYRMKTIGIGLEPAPIRMTTFIGALQKAPRRMQSWWLSPDYKCVKVNEAGTAMQMVGQGVKLSTDILSFANRGKAARSKVKVSTAAKRYAKSFTSKFEKIAEVRPVFRQLRTVMDLLIAAAWLRKENGLERVGWRPVALLDEEKIATQTGNVPKAVACVANAVWKQHVLLLPVGGGVSISPNLAIESENRVTDKSGKLSDLHRELKPDAPANWWWD